MAKREPHPFPKLAGKPIHFEPPLFPQHTLPIGLLHRDIEDQALWYYYVLAYQASVKHRTAVVMEGDKDPTWDVARIYMSVCKLYGVDPQTLTNRWPRIESEIARYNQQRRKEQFIAQRAHVPMKVLEDQFKFPSRFIGKPLEGMYDA